MKYRSDISDCTERARPTGQQALLAILANLTWASQAKGPCALRLQSVRIVSVHSHCLSHWDIQIVAS